MVERKIKVMTLICNMDNGGAQKIVLNYLRDFKNDNDIEFKVFSYKTKHLTYCDQRIKEENLNVEYLYISPFLCFIPFLRNYIIKKKWTKAIKKFNPDIVHTHISSLLEETLDPIISNNVPIKFSTLHSNPLRFHGKTLETIKNAFQNKNFIPICITNEQALLAKKCYGFDKYEVVYNGIDIENIKNNIITKQEARKKYNLSKNTFVVLGVGRLNNIKRFDLLIEIFSNIIKIKKDSILILAGNGPEEANLKKLVNKLNIEKNVIFLGYEDNVVPLYCAADVLAMTSYSEASSLVLLEAQICNLRSVVSDGVPSESIVSDIVKKMKKNSTLDDWSKSLLDEKIIGKKVEDINNYEIHTASENMKKVYLKYWKEYIKNK